MAYIPGLTNDQVNNLAQASAGLGVQDKYEITAAQRAVSGAYERAQRQYNTGVQTNQNNLTLALKRANMNLGKNRLTASSNAAEQVSGYSPAVLGASLAGAGNKFAQSSAQANQDQAAAMAALQRSYQEAGLTQASAAAELVLDAARRRDYANEIRKYS